MSEPKNNGLQRGRLSEKRAGLLTRFLKWLTKGAEASPPCQG
jgi:hypothetical protein